MDSDSTLFSSDDEGSGVVNHIDPDEVFLDELKHISNVERDRIKQILGSKLMKNNSGSKSGFQREVERIYAEDIREGCREFIFLRQYLTAVENLPINEENLGPVTPKKIFLMKHTSDHLDNLAIKMMNAIVGTECHVVSCPENTNAGAYLGYKNDYNSEEPSIGAIIRGVSDCHRWDGMIVFTHAENMLKYQEIHDLFNRKNRRKFKDQYLSFPVDISEFTFLLFVDETDSIPPNYREHFHQMDYYSWLQVIEIPSKSRSSTASVRDTDSVMSLDTVNEDLKYTKNGK